MRIAVEGCCHGELDTIYSNILRIQEELQQPIDLLLCCGDFQCTRDGDDLNFLCCPPKYRSLKDFPAYYKGEKHAPLLTIFIGGNHEASNVLRELYYGGWVAPNIFYLGHAGVVRVGGELGELRIAGLSGIYKQHDYRRGHYERPPCESNALYSACHVREFEVLKLQQLTGKVDIMMSHDWPESIYNYGDSAQLLRCKPHFASDIREHSLGNPHTMRLLQLMKPSFWFAGHLHVGFAAIYVHPDSAGHATRFLALDKVLPRRRFLQVLEADPAAPAGYRVVKPPVCPTHVFSASSDSPLCSSSSLSSVPAAARSANSESIFPVSIYYDVEWLAILRANQLHIPTSRTAGTYTVVPPTDSDFAQVRENLRRSGLRRRPRRLSSPRPDSRNGVETSADSDAAGNPSEGWKTHVNPTEEADTVAKEDRKTYVNVDEYEWPHWDNPAAHFQNLSQQRIFLLRLLGYEENDDVLWRKTAVPTSTTERAEVRWRDGHQPQKQQNSNWGQQLQPQQEQEQVPIGTVTTVFPPPNEEVDICCSFASEDEDET